MVATLTIPGERFTPDDSILAQQLEQRRRSAVFIELHLHKGRGSGHNKWYLTDVVRTAGDRPTDKSCSVKACTILTVDIVAAEFLEPWSDGSIRYTPIDPALLKKGI